MNIPKLVKLEDIPLNLTTQYLLPSINLLTPHLEAMKIDGIKRDASDILTFYGFKNAYLWDKEHWNSWYYDKDGKFTRPYQLVLLFNPSASSLAKWYIFHDYYKRHSGYKYGYDLDLGVVCLVFSIHASNLLIRNYFMEGKYSKFTQNYTRTNFIVFDGTRSKWLRQLHICTQQESYREELSKKIGYEIPRGWELEERWTEESDVLNYQRLKKKI